MEKNMSQNEITDVEFVEVPKVPDEFAVETEDTKRETRLLELTKPINEQIAKCESRADILLMASAMMVTAKDLFICELGVDAAKIMFSNLKFENPVDDEPQND
jgi:hypothetical protein